MSLEKQVEAHVANLLSMGLRRDQISEKGYDFALALLDEQQQKGSAVTSALMERAAEMVKRALYRIDNNVPIHAISTASPEEVDRLRKRIKWISEHPTHRSHIVLINDQPVPNDQRLSTKQREINENVEKEREDLRDYLAACEEDFEQKNPGLKLIYKISLDAIQR